VADDSWPSPNHNSRAVSSDELDALLSPYVPSGLIGRPTDLDIVFADSSGRNVKVRAERHGLVHGRLWYSGSSTVTLTIAANGSGNDRYDLVVLRYNKSTYDIRATVITGVAGSGVPDPIDSVSYFDVPLGFVKVEPGASVIAGDHVTASGYFIASTAYESKAAYPPPHAPLRLWRESNTGIVRFSTGSAWIVLHQDTGWLTRPASSGFTVPGEGYGVKFRSLNGFATLAGEVQRSGTLGANSRAPIMSVDPAYAPAQRLPVRLWAAGNDCLGAIQANGTVTIDTHPTLGGGANIVLHATTWPVGG
jgi:hypothetical protein